jgi:membrane protease YdiL (CAAX protease family)
MEPEQLKNMEIAARGAPEPAPTRPPLRARRGFLIYVLFNLGQLLGAVVAGVAIGVVAGYRAAQTHSHLRQDLSTTFIIWGAIVGLLTGGAIAYRLTRRSVPDLKARASAVDVAWSFGTARQLLLAALTGLALGISYLFAVAIVPTSRSGSFGPLATAAVHGGPSRHAWAVLGVVLAPPIEEFVFRGVLFRAFANSWGMRGGAVAVTLLFVLSHAPEIYSYWPACGAILLLGIATLGFRVWSGALGPSIALHASYNAVLATLVYYADA